MATSPGAGRGTPSSSKKITKNRPPVWWSRTKRRTARVSGRHQLGSRSQSGRAKAGNGARASSKLARFATSACRRRQNLLGGTPLEFGAEDVGEVLGIRAGRGLRSDLHTG